MIYAVLDTNVIVSALMSGNPKSPTKRCLKAAVSCKVRPLYNNEIIAEYRDVLSRKKFDFDQDKIEIIIRKIISVGLKVEPMPSAEVFADKSDRVFYEIALAKSANDAKVVTGNTRHFPQSPIVVTPSEFCVIADI